jgi:hypothetical protein
MSSNSVFTSHAKNDRKTLEKVLSKEVVNGPAAATHKDRQSYKRQAMNSHSSAGFSLGFCISVTYSTTLLVL